MHVCEADVLWTRARCLRNVRTYRGGNTVRVMLDPKTHRQCRRKSEYHLVPSRYVVPQSPTNCPAVPTARCSAIAPLREFLQRRDKSLVTAFRFRKTPNKVLSSAASDYQRAGALDSLSTLTLVIMRRHVYAHIRCALRNVR